MENALNTIAEFFSQTPMVFIATTAGDKPKVRAFQFQFEQDGKLWFCTGKSKDVYTQMQANPAIQICAVKKNMSWLRVDSQVVFEDNKAIKERILAEQALIKSLYGSADNPQFATLYIEHGDYTIADFSGNPPDNGSF